MSKGYIKEINIIKHTLPKQIKISDKGDVSQKLVLKESILLRTKGPGETL